MLLADFDCAVRADGYYADGFSTKYYSCLNKIASKVSHFKFFFYISFVCFTFYLH